MKWYISGKISGLPTDQVTAKFQQAEQQIRAFGHEPVNPINNGLGSEASWNEHLVADVALLLECDAIYLLKDWDDSRGSRIEANIAEECGLQIVHQPEYATYESRMLASRRSPIAVCRSSAILQFRYTAVFGSHAETKAQDVTRQQNPKNKEINPLATQAKKTNQTT